MNQCKESKLCGGLPKQNYFLLNDIKKYHLKKNLIYWNLKKKERYEEIKNIICNLFEGIQLKFNELAKSYEISF